MEIPALDRSAVLGSNSDSGLRFGFGFGSDFVDSGSHSDLYSNSNLD